MKHEHIIADLELRQQSLTKSAAFHGEAVNTLRAELKVAERDLADAKVSIDRLDAAIAHLKAAG